MAAKMLVRSLAVVAVAFFRVGDCLASTDTITWGGDNSRAGYFPNNNMDPAVVTSSDFGQVFKVLLPGNYLGQPEKIFSQPLIYTPQNGDGTQYVYWATAQNNVYKMNAKTGAIVASRNLHIPFMSADLSGENQDTPGYCQDINPTVGIIATGVIDPDTDTLYLTAKTYEDQTKVGVPQGRPAGRIYVHALDANDLSERPGFPFHFEGLGARNNPSRLFNGGIQNQRPGLLHPKGSDYIYAGFGSHCVNYNFTGWVVGFHKTTGKLVEYYATQGEGVPSPKKGASLWMSGGGITSDDKGSMFFATGNGYSGQVGDVSINRGSIPTSLEEAVVHMTYNADGSVTPVDFFIPANIGYLNGGDLDIGTSPVAMLPSDAFACGSVKRIGVVTGKDHTTWFLDLDDLGGFQTGAGRGDRVLGKYGNENSVYAGVGVYPLEGGYIYVNVIGFKSRVFKYSCAGGVPSFTRVAESPAGGKNGFGVSHGTVTSLNGQPGTGLYWVTDVDDANPEGYSVRIYDAVPNGEVMKLVKGFAVGGINKFTRPHFGDGIVYFGSSQGYVYAFGAPTNPALNCTAGPLDFGTTAIGAQSAAKTITCTAKIALTVANISLASADFSVTDVPAFPRQMAAQSSFSFKATFNPSTYGNLSATVALSTTNSAGGYAKTASVRLTGAGESAGALLVVTPDHVTFSQAVVGADTVVESVLLSNPGKALLTVQSIQFSEVSLTGPFVAANVTGSQSQFGLFTLGNLPSTIAASAQQLVTVGFNPAATGDYSLYVNITSDGGSVGLTIKASAGGTPVALIQLETPDGSGWQTWTPGSSAALSFGTVVQNTDRRLRFRITNTAPAGSVPLNIPISKPPFGVPGLIGTVNQADLGEGTVIAAGEYAEAVIVCTAPKQQWNTDSYTNVTSWVFNTNDVTLGKVEVPFTCTATAQQGGPLKDDGQGLYRYVGCFRENYPSGRQLKQQLYSAKDNAAAKCLAACAAKSYAFCGLQYHSECWGGPTPPAVQVGESNCNFDCSGDADQWCGGNGLNELAGNSMISLFATNTTLPPNPGGPFVNPGVNGYTSIGCYTEATTGRALAKGINTGGVKTVAACVNACSALNYKFVGLEYGGECWCDNSFAAGSVPTAIGDCSMTCGDNSTEYCGAGSRLNVYQREGTGPTPTSLSSTTTSSGTATSSGTPSLSTTTGAATPTSTGIRQTIGLYRYQGCYDETTLGGRSLGGKTYTDDLMTLEKCADACAGYTFWGTEYERECYCGPELRGNTALDVDQTSCKMLCKGDKTQFCGGSSRLSVYKFDASLNVTTSSSSSVSSTTSVSSTSASSESSTSSSDGSTVTSSSTSASSSDVSTTSSTESSSSSTSESSSSTSDVSTSSATSSTTSDTATSTSGSSTSTSESVTSTSESSTSTSESVTSTSESATFTSESSSSSESSTSTSESVTSTSESSTSISDSSTSASDSSTSIEPTSTSSTSTTSSSTSTISSSTSASPSSTSSSSTSTSSSSTGSTSSTSTSPTSTSTSSSSTPSSSSTTASSTSATSTSTSTSPSLSATATPLWPGNVNYTYYGCVAEPSNGRLLKKQVISADDMTQEKCLQAAWMYKYAGVEYGRECWVGDGPINWAGNAGATPGFNASESDCSKPCPGNSTERCGASKRLNLFVRRDKL